MFINLHYIPNIYYSYLKKTKKQKNSKGQANPYVKILLNFLNWTVISNIKYKVLSSNPVHGEVYSIQHYVIKFVIDLRQVVGFLRVLRFSQPKKMLLKMALSIINLTPNPIWLWGEIARQWEVRWLIALSSDLKP